VAESRRSGIPRSTSANRTNHRRVGRYRSRRSQESCLDMLGIHGSSGTCAARKLCWPPLQNQACAPPFARQCRGHLGTGPSSPLYSLRFLRGPGTRHCRFGSIERYSRPPEREGDTVASGASVSHRRQLWRRLRGPIWIASSVTQDLDSRPAPSIARPSSWARARRSPGLSVPGRPDTKPTPGPSRSIWTRTSPRNRKAPRLTIPELPKTNTRRRVRSARVKCRTRRTQPIPSTMSGCFRSTGRSDYLRARLTDWSRSGQCCAYHPYHALSCRRHSHPKPLVTPSHEGRIRQRQIADEVVATLRILPKPATSSARWRQSGGTR